jgi:hypothetical protein
MQNRIALEFAWIRRRGSYRSSGRRPCRRHAPDFLSQFGVFSFDLVEARHDVIERCRSRRAAECDQAKSSACCPRKKLIPHGLSPRFEPDSTSGRRERNVYHMPIGRLGRPVNQISMNCHKNGTLILLQCSNLSHIAAMLSHLRVARPDLCEFPGL